MHDIHQYVDILTPGDILKQAKIFVDSTHVE